MTSHREDSILAGRIQDLKNEIASKDYQVIKAARLGMSIDDLYPGHTAWYQQKMEQLYELDEIEKQQNKAEIELLKSSEKKKG